MKKVIKTKHGTVSKADSTQMIEEEFFARVDEAKKGSSKSFVNVDELDKYIRAL